MIHDTNSIHAVAIPNRQFASIRNAWENTHKMLVTQGHPPNLHILDNECSQELKDDFAKYNIAFQRVPPKEHCANAAERSIRTFKNHFIATLCTVDSHFPMTEWDRLLLLTLNLLRSSCKHPSLSAHASLFGNYNFNRVPLAPPGTKIVAHVAADTWTTFGQHGKAGWYIGPSPEHYRCYKCYFTGTMKERDVLTVLFPKSPPQTISNKLQKICSICSTNPSPIPKPTLSCLVRPSSTLLQKLLTFFDVHSLLHQHQHPMSNL
jgi:hypothetical protein